MNILITGASSGIGRATALRFACDNNAFVLIARREEKLNDLRDEIMKNNSQARVHIICADLSEQHVISEVATQALHFFSKQIDILINNAGVFFPAAISDAQDSLPKMLPLNLYAPYYLTRELLPAITAREGYIFNICSVASLQPYPQGGIYGITKYALLGFSDNLREEMKDKNVKVIAVCPGATYTDSWLGTDVPAERMMAAEDVAQMIYSSTQLSASAVVERIVMRPQLGDI